MPLYETGDIEQDYAATRGLTFVVAFTLIPLDLTGCTAVFSIAGLVDIPMTVAIAGSGAFTESTLSSREAATVTSAWIAGLYDYVIRVTFPGGDVWPMGHGKVQVK